MRLTASWRSSPQIQDISTHLGLTRSRCLPRRPLIPQLVLAGSDDRITGTQRPYAYFRKYFEQGAPWTFVVQNKVPHCCIINAKALVLQWLDAVVVRRLTRSTGSYGFIKTRASEAADCPKPSARCSDLVSRRERHVGWRELVGQRRKHRPASEPHQRG